MIKIEVTNQGLTNAMEFSSRDKDAKYDIEGLLKREGIHDRIVDLASYKDFNDIKWNFNKLLDSIYTCIKFARYQNFQEEFWKDWEDKE